MSSYPYLGYKDDPTVKLDDIHFPPDRPDEVFLVYNLDDSSKSGAYTVNIKTGTCVSMLKVADVQLED